MPDDLATFKPLTFRQKNMDISIGDIAKLLDAEIIGDPSVKINNVSGVAEAEEGHLTFVIDPKYVPALEKTKASAVLIQEDIQAKTNIPQIRVKKPKEAFRKLTEAFSPPPIEFAPGIHPTAVVAEDAVLGKNVSVQPYAVIESGATIGDNVVVGAHSYIGHFTSIGDDSLLYPRVTIRERISIGKRVIIHPGVVIGADGFGYEQEKGKNIKILQIGNVIIEDDVEIGANTTIDRARFDKTVIKRGTKIDNLVMIAHNCSIGEDTIICGQAGISGSSKVGNNVILAGQAGLVGHIKIADKTIVGAQCGVTKDIEKPGLYIGSPALPHLEKKKQIALITKLRDMYRSLKKIENKLEIEN